MINWKPIRKVEYIVIHCAATTEDKDIGAEEIRGWHLQRGWLDIGYHRVIRRDGTIENGRDLEYPARTQEASTTSHGASASWVALSLTTRHRKQTTPTLNGKHSNVKFGTCLCLHRTHK